MLREWTTAGYVTRDFTNFATPVIYGRPPAAMPPKLEAPVPPTAPPVEPAMLPKAVPAPSLKDVAVNSATKEVAAPTKILGSKDKEKAAIAPAPAKVTACVVRSVSVNTAAEDELTAVAGLSAKLARAIIRKRPFTSLNDLRQVKGLSASLLMNIHSRLRL